MSGIQLITNWPEIYMAGSLICFHNQTGDRDVRLAWEMERFEKWLGYAHHRLAQIKAERGTVVPIVGVCAGH